MAARFVGEPMERGRLIRSARSSLVPRPWTLGKSRTLVVMAKEPVPGKVKTRLVPLLGAEGACQLYRAFLLDIAARFGIGPHELVWAVSPPGADLGVPGVEERRIPQRGADLGERMRNVFAQLFNAGARRVVMIGADVPHLPTTVLSDAFAQLETHDVVLVPTRDGGYALIGLARAHDLFTSIAMGSKRVFRDTLARAAELCLRVHSFPETFDVDEPADLAELQQLITRGAVHLPATAQLLGIR